MDNLDQLYKRSLQQGLHELNFDAQSKRLKLEYVSYSTTCTVPPLSQVLGASLHVTASASSQNQVVRAGALQGFMDTSDCDYKDYSTEPDPDPLTPLTPVGRVPNFPAKMHAILARDDLSDIVSWMPHGRSWRVWKPTEFEAEVIPKYFGHAKYSSFQRQANGWGFRRITRGTDIDSYCNPLFLRGLPHLCKMMIRCGSVKDRLGKSSLDDLDLYKISAKNPVPENYNDDSVLLPCTILGGPKARLSLERKAPVLKLSDFKRKTKDSTSDAGNVSVEQPSVSQVTELLSGDVFDQQIQPLGFEKLDGKLITPALNSGIPSLPSSSKLNALADISMTCPYNNLYSTPTLDTRAVVQKPANSVTTEVTLADLLQLFPDVNQRSLLQNPGSLFEAGYALASAMKVNSQLAELALATALQLPSASPNQASILSGLSGTQFLPTGHISS